MKLSSLAHKLRKARLKYRVNLKVHDSYWASQLERFNVDPAFVRCDKDSLIVSLDGLQIRLSKPEHAFFLNGLSYARALHKEAGAHFKNKDDLILIGIGELSFEVRTFEELYILHEVFVEGVYNIKIPSPVVMIDIGANVGFCSVLFAHNANIVRVVSFEPVELTYQHARRNLALNRPHSEKIDLHNYGLSDKTETIEIEFSDEIKGSVGIRGIDHRDDIDRSQITRVQLKLREAGSEIARIVDQCGRTPVILKIDCEGSEYRIVDSLIAKGQLTRIAAIMMEWHEPSLLPDLEDKLVAAGFAIFSLSPNSASVGMIYAARGVAPA
jgi:FkbM family methyltransferase